MCYDHLKKYIAKALQPIPNFQKYQTICNMVIGECHHHRGEDGGIIETTYQ